MPVQQKPKMIYAEHYKKGDFIPPKEEVVKLLKKKQTSVHITKMAKYSDGKEVVTIVITHE